MSMQVPIGSPVGIDTAYRWMQPTPDWPVGREGDAIVFFQGTSLPGCCVRCAAPATRSVRKTFYWHSPWIYLALLANILVYALIAGSVRKSAVVDVPFCEQHFMVRRRAMLAAWAAALVPLALTLALGSLLDSDAFVGMLCIALTFGPLTALLIAIFAVKPLRAAFIGDRIVKLRNAGDAFLALCPRC